MHLEVPRQTLQNVLYLNYIKKNKGDIMKSNYILQIHTGSFQNAHTNLQEIKNKIGPILKKQSIKAVIFGWHLDHNLNQSILDYFHQQGIACYFWLPVLSEIDLIKESIGVTNYTGNQAQKVSVIEDESFSFLCPTHQESIHNVCALYEEQLSSLNFDGIFLDKIRFSSFVNGYEEGFGCFCDTCNAVFEEHEVDVVYLKELFATHDEKLLQGAYDQIGHYHFADSKVQAFYQVRSQMITNLVGTLCDYFHEKNLKVGLDIYAPFFAYHCGQDIQALSQKADFLKPMFYRYTQAPAGMQYEYDAYKQYFQNTSAFILNPIGEEALAMQVNFLKQAKCAVYPGIEVNAIENICSVNPEKFKDSRDFFHEYFDTMVCCWNCLLMGGEIESEL